MKIGIVGCGNVGSASAYACALRGVGTSLTLIDHNHALAVAQAEDILHATPFAKSMPVNAGTYDDLDGAGIVMISAGVNQKPGETRLDLLKRNADIFAAIIPEIIKAAPGCIMLIASNPVDVMTHWSAKMAVKHGFAAERIIGSGTILDTARFRTLIARQARVSSHSVHAHVIGEHGDSEVLHWSQAHIASTNIDDFGAQTGHVFTPDIRAEIDQSVRRAAYRIIQGKGATWYGIGAGMARIARAITENENAILTCCAPVQEIAGVHDVTLSLPRIIAGRGIVSTLMPSLSETEEQQLRKSATILKDAINDLPSL